MFCIVSEHFAVVTYYISKMSYLEWSQFNLGSCLLFQKCLFYFLQCLKYFIFTELRNNWTIHLVLGTKFLWHFIFFPVWAFCLGDYFDKSLIYCLLRHFNLALKKILSRAIFYQVKLFNFWHRYQILLYWIFRELWLG